MFEECQFEIMREVLLAFINHATVITKHIAQFSFVYLSGGYLNFASKRT